MELWIRSQDKTSLTKIDNICVVDNRIVFIPNNHNGRVTLGTYKTNARALEVLDEIQKMLEIKYSFQNVRYEDADISLKGAILCNMVKYYVMPQE